MLLLVFLALAFALFLPYIIQARLAALREEKVINLKQLVLACHNYNDTYTRLPPGNDANNISAAAKLLPFLEQDNLYKQIDLKKPVGDKANAAVRAMPVPVFLSPNDPRMMVTKQYGATNYLFNAGTKPSLARNDGVFFQDSQSRIPATFTDGLSNTIVIGETLKGDGGRTAKDVARQHVELGKDALKGLKEDAGTADWKEDKHFAGDRCSSWMDGRFLQGTFNGGRLPNDPRPDVDCGGLGGWSALRSLEDRVNVAMGDGSVRPIRAKIKPEVWKALITPAGGEVLPADF
jgi:prepilin-type processing-associated H-X9-DG protein